MKSDIIGYLAATLTTVSFVPQVLKTWRVGSAADVSLGMYSIFVIGTIMWLIYGLCVSAWPVVIANAITLVLACIILIMKLRWN